MRRRGFVRVASSANLGPGYDVFAAAISLLLELEVAETGEFLVVGTFRACRSIAPTSACGGSSDCTPLTA